MLHIISFLICFFVGTHSENQIKMVLGLRHPAVTTIKSQNEFKSLKSYAT